MRNPLIATFLFLCLVSASGRLSAQCSPDTEAPVASCIPSSNVVLTLGQTSVLSAAALNNGSTDNCSAQLSFFINDGPPAATLPATTSLVLDDDDIGAHTVTFWAVDESGNFSNCTGTVQVTNDCSGSSQTLVCNDEITVLVPPGENVLVYPGWVLEGGPYCSDYQIGLGVPGSFVNYLSLGSDDIGSHVVSVKDVASGNLCWGYINVLADDTVFYALTGAVFHDGNSNCAFDIGENTLSGWKIKAVGNNSGRTYKTSSGALGIYEINDIYSVDTELELSLDVPINYGQNCPTTWTVNTIPGMPAVQHIPVQLDAECALIEVQLAAPYLRRCFDNTYTVSYCNYSASLIENTYLEVTLDTFMSFMGSSIPGNPVSGNTYTFATGNLAAGERGSFTIQFKLSCNAELGQTHCSEARMYPDTLCPQNANWTGANIEVSGACINDEINLTIHNTGTGNMAAPLDFIVVEDVIMYMQGDFNLGAGQSYQIPTISANGATWRLEAQQAPNHPYPGNVAVALEGCAGINVLGLVNLFPTENPNPFIATDCQENIGSFDPNDKQAIPAGFRTEHFISRNTDIEYLIRFQNTGTDTAFTVVVLDTLSQYLDPASIRPGPGSHPYSFEMLPGNTLRFTFANILLPDSSTNLTASQGFVQFRAKQQPDLALGSVIENTAAIYFDFNAPIITNQVFHTIGENFIEVINDTHEHTNIHGEPLVFPNPALGAVTFALPQQLPENSHFVLYGPLGNMVRQSAATGDRFVFERGELAPGSYFYAFENNGKKWWTGKLVLR